MPDIPDPFDLSNRVPLEEQLELVAQVLNDLEDLDRADAGLPPLPADERWQTL